MMDLLASAASEPDQRPRNVDRRSIRRKVDVELVGDFRGWRCVRHLHLGRTGTDGQLLVSNPGPEHSTVGDQALAMVRGDRIVRHLFKNSNDGEFERGHEFCERGHAASRTTLGIIEVAGLRTCRLNHPFRGQDRAVRLAGLRPLCEEGG